MKMDSNIGGPKIRATEIKRSHMAAIEAGDVTQAQADLVYWLYCYAADNNMQNGTVADRIGYDPSNISRIYKCTYTGNWEKVCEAIEKAKADIELSDERRKYGEAGFVETTISRAIFEVCEATRMNQEISQVWGESQTGKSEALKRYTQLNNHGRTRYIELESGMSHQGFLRYVAEACNAPLTGDVCTLKRAIKNAITENTLLIFDEIHKPLLASGPSTKIKIMDSIRDLNDKVKCGIILCGTNTLRTEFTVGSIKDVLKQMDKRGVIKCKCPDVLPVSDVWSFAASYGLDRPSQKSTEAVIAARVNRTNGIGILIKFLRAGREYAGKRREPYGWQHFVEAHDIIVSNNHKDWNL
jgi:DNA transposition AAA+ family ATPase